MLTLEQYSNLYKLKEPDAVMVYLLQEKSIFMNLVSQKPVSELSFPVIRQAPGSGGSYVAINQAITTESSPKYAVNIVSMKKFIDNMRVDNSLIKAYPNITGEMFKTQLGQNGLDITRILLKHASSQWTPAVMPDAPDGLYKLLAYEHEQLYGTQIEVATSTNVALASDRERSVAFTPGFEPNGVFVAGGSATAATRLQFTGALDRLVNGFPEKPNWLYCPRQIISAITEAGRQSGTYAPPTLTQWGIWAETWGGVPLIPCDMTQDNRELLGFDETQGGDTTCASIIAVNSDQSFGTGYQIGVNTAPEMKLITQNMEGFDASLYRIIIHHNHFIGHPRAVRRLAGLKIG